MISSAGPQSEWSIRHLLVCGSIAIDWTLIGFAVDVARARPTPKAPIRENRPEEVAAPDPLREAFEELERQVRERRPPEPLGRSKRAA